MSTILLPLFWYDPAPRKAGGGEIIIPQVYSVASLAILAREPLSTFRVDPSVESYCQIHPR